MSTFYQRVAEAADETFDLYKRLHEAGLNNGWKARDVEIAIEWAAIQLDPKADDYETWETTVLARLENPNKGER